MLRRLFPPQFDERFDGHALALWILGVLVALKLVMAVNSIVNTAAVAGGADGFPLQSYGGGGAQAVLMLFAAGAMAQLTLAALGLAALLRYRSMLPFLYLLLLFEFAGRRFIVQAYAVERAQTGSSGVAINVALLALLLGGLGLSLWPRKASPPAA